MLNAIFDAENIFWCQATQKNILFNVDCAHIICIAPISQTLTFQCNDASLIFLVYCIKEKFLQVKILVDIKICMMAELLLARGGSFGA